MRVDAEPFFVGKIVGFHGLKGTVKIAYNTNNPLLLCNLKQVSLVAKDSSRTLTILQIRLTGGLILMNFEEHLSRTLVTPWLGAKVFANFSEIGALSKDEYWVKDLIKLDVFTTTGRYLGHINSIIYSGNDLLEIQTTDNKVILVPFVRDLVPTVDLTANRVEVIDLPGLLEPQ